MLGSSPNLSKIAVIASFIAFVLYRLWIWYHLRHIPGPFWGSFSKIWMIGKILGGRNHLDMLEVCEKYGERLHQDIRSDFAQTFLIFGGSLVRIGPTDVLTNDYEVVRRMQGVRSPYTRSDWYIAAKLDPPHENTFSQRDEKIHNSLRAKLAAGVCH